MEKALLYRPLELTKVLGLSKSKVYELIASKRIPSIKIGRAIRVPRDELENWIKEQAEQSRDEACL